MDATDATDAMGGSPYDDFAEWYDQWVGAHSMRDDPYFPAVEALLGEVAGLRVCDLACGQGRVARYLADQGARVVGVDLSAKLLEMARRRETAEPRGVAYLHADAQRLASQPPAALAPFLPFDGVICFMALMDIPDLPATLQSVASILRSGGWFVFAVLHPCYHTARSGEVTLPEGTVRTVGRYFAEGYWRSDARTGPPGKIGAYHRTLSAYVNALADVGLTLERMSEPRAYGDFGDFGDSPAAAGAHRPVWAEVPAVLVVRCRKS